MNIIFPELNHPSIQQAIALYRDRQQANYKNPLHPDTTLPELTVLPATDLANACTKLSFGQADAMIAGIAHSSRDVILACRDYLGLSGTTFSGLAIMQRSTPISNQNANQIYLLADMAACKHPTTDQLTEITLQTIASARQILTDLPRVALLSFSTFGSGGKDPTIDLMRNVLTNVNFLAATHHFAGTFAIDGEMQLDAALNPTIATSKAAEWTTRQLTKDTSPSPVAGQANVLIAPDLNTGNILYKSFEQIGGFHVAGPILQGFRYPVSDLSRGSTPEDIYLTICALALLS